MIGHSETALCCVVCTSGPAVYHNKLPWTWLYG